MSEGRCIWNVMGSGGSFEKGFICTNVPPFFWNGVLVCWGRDGRGKGKRIDENEGE